MSLDAQLYYEELPSHKYKITKKGGHDMPQTTQKEVKQYAKTRGEHYKDIVIAILVTGIVAFILGTNYQSKQAAHVQAAVSQVQTVKK